MRPFWLKFWLFIGIVGVNIAFWGLLAFGLLGSINPKQICALLIVGLLSMLLLGLHTHPAIAESWTAKLAKKVIGLPKPLK